MRSLPDLEVRIISESFQISRSWLKERISFIRMMRKRSDYEGWGVFKIFLVIRSQPEVFFVLRFFNKIIYAFIFQVKNSRIWRSGRRWRNWEGGWKVGIYEALALFVEVNKWQKKFYKNFNDSMSVYTSVM